MAILLLLTFIVMVCITGLLCFSLVIHPLAWYWVLSPIWIVWGMTVLAFLIFAPIAVYFKDKTTGGR